MRYLSVCSGIEAATVAWEPLGWEPYGFSEIEKFPCAVLQHHYPDVPNFGDMNDFRKWPRADIDVLVGGTPCQSFSVAGLRKGMADPRGNLALVYLAIAEQFRPDWLVWENVPGVLSSNGGRDFGSIVGGMVELGYSLSYRVLDAQYFGVPQRRRRVFVVGHSGGNWQYPAAVLFERESLQRRFAPGPGAREEVTPAITSGNGVGYSNAEGNISNPCLTACDLENYTGNRAPLLYSPQVAPTLSASGPPFSRPGQGYAEASGNYIAFDYNAGNNMDLQCGEQSPTIKANGNPPAVAFDFQGGPTNPMTMHENQSPVLTTTHTPAIQHQQAVRRFTPNECARLQGFPDHWARIPWRNKPTADCPDGPQYKAYGNSMAVPVMRWIGERIQLIDQLTSNAC